MNTKPLELNFSASTVAQWEEAARQELDGANPNEKLAFSKADLTIKPYYTEKDIPAFRVNSIPVSQNEFLGARTWLNMPKVIVENDKKANEEALLHLNHGADGILFELTGSTIDVSKLFHQVELQYCSVSFLTNNTQSSFFEDFKVFVEKKAISDKITGSVFWKQGDEPAALFEAWPLFYGLGIMVEEKNNPSEEIAEALMKAITQGEKYFSEKKFLQQVAFLVPTGSDFFLEIAKIKTLKHLWAVIERAYGTTTRRTVPVHAFSKSWINASFEPHGNLIKQTTAGLSAVMGGCDALTIEPDSHANEMTARIARNVSALLREESHLAHVADPTAGSYYLESMTSSLVSASWKKFQTLAAQ